MKNNDSMLFPFNEPDDKAFDRNNDGKLTGLETMERDAYLLNLYEQTSKPEVVEDFTDTVFRSGNRYTKKRKRKPWTEKHPIATGVILLVFFGLLYLFCIVEAIKGHSPVLILISSAILIPAIAFVVFGMKNS